MHRLLIGTVVMALSVVAVQAADDAKPQKPQALFMELVKSFRAAKSPAEQQSLLETYANKFLDYAAKNPKEPDAIDALVIVIQQLPPNIKGKPRDKAVASLKKDFVDNKEAAKPVRAKACSLYMGMQEETMTTGSGKAAADAKKEMERIRKLAKTELAGMVKDVYVGASIAALKSKDLNDKDVKIEDYKGKVVMLDVWATWCPPCRAMIPHSKEMVEKYKDKPFVLVGVSVDAKKETLTEFMKTNDMPWTHWWCGATGGLAAELSVNAYPTIFLVDAKGVIRKKYRGSPGAAVLDKEVEALVKETEDKTKAGTGTD